MKNCRQLREVQNPTRQDHIDMLSQSDCWPNFTLPLVKKYGNRLPKSREYRHRHRHHGVIIKEHASTGMFVVKFSNMFMLPDTFDEYCLLDGIEYNTAEELVDDGWCVD